MDELKGIAFGVIEFRRYSEKTENDYAYANQTLAKWLGDHQPVKAESEEKLLLDRINRLVDVVFTYRTIFDSIQIDVSSVGIYFEDDWKIIFKALEPLLIRGTKVHFTSENGQIWKFESNQDGTYEYIVPEEFENESEY